MSSEKAIIAQQLLIKLGKVVHQFQRERGCACLFIDSLGKIFSKRLTLQTKELDDAIDTVKSFCSGPDVKANLPKSFEGRLNFLLQKYDDLNNVRDKIHLLNLRYTQALNSYTFSYIIPTIDAMIELAQAEPDHNSALVSAYSNFLQWKERVGMERALGSRGFYTFSFRSQEFRDRFVALIAEQRTYFDTFKALASPSQIALFHKLLNEQNFDALTKINTLLENDAPPAEIEKYSEETWFELLTDIIDDLHKIETSLILGLEGKKAPAGNSQIATINACSVASANGKVEEYRGFLKTLPTFSTLKDIELDELLSFAQIREYEKDKLLFLRDEPTSRLYIILEGWVKVFNGLETGEEAILQVLGSGETLLESAVFLNVLTPMSAQIVENALLLSIPAPVIRQRIQSSPQLAINMLNAVSMRSQHLVQQIELSRLKSAQERVGWFLLRLALTQKSPDGVVYLPYEKSVIASYLDMRPETFSRTLQKFKKEGFEISSDSVKIPDYQALCSFCDVDLAAGCSRARTHDCPRPDLLEMIDLASNN